MAPGPGAIIPTDVCHSVSDPVPEIAADPSPGTQNLDHPMSPIHQLVDTGELVAERFRIVRFIAEGGMGEVYEAEDTVLRENVALKFLNRRNIDNEHVARRFRREILLARKVTHPNVCRLFDVFRHHLADGSRVAFVTMELLAGETLEEHLENHGAMNEDEALPIVRQMAEGLAAAHAVGVVHRDFKANNVILVPAPAYAYGWRAVITDFGLARSTGGTEFRNRGPTHSPLTGELKLVGTADYMAPEQLHGEEVTPISDLYALGVVMFEMVTGERPYEGANPVALLARRISEPPRRPSDVRPGLDPTWEQLILACLENDPAERPASAWDVIVALTGESTPLGPSPSGSIQRPQEIQELAEAYRARVQSGELDRPAAIPWKTVLLAFLGLGLVAVLWLALAPAEPEPPVDTRWPATPRRLTPEASLELDPALSPDGRRVAYSSNRRGRFEIWLRDLDTGAEEALDLGNGQLFQPAFSADGERLVYHDRLQGGIWEVELGGSPRPRQLTDFGSDPVIAPDGRRVVFQSTSSPLLADTAAPALADSTLWSVDRESGQLETLTERGQPAGGHAAPTFSPDGEFLAFSTSAYGGSEIWSLRLEDRQLDALVTSREGYDPIFAPDGAALYFSSSQRQVKGLWRLTLEEGVAVEEPREIRNLGLASIRQLTFDASGDRAIYTTLETRSELWTLTLDFAGSAIGPAQPLTGLGGRNNRPAFSPDGSHLAFDHWDVGTSIDLWTLALDGGPAQQRTRLDDDASQPQWSREGDALLFHRGPRGERRMWAIGLDGSPGAATEPVPLADLPGDVYWVALAPDGRRLAYHSSLEGEVGLWVQELGLEARLLLELRDLERDNEEEAAFLGFPCWSPDGRWLAFQHKRGEDDTQIVTLQVDDGAVTTLPELAGQNWPYSISPDGDRIAFAALRDGTWSLRWISRQTGREQLLTTIDQLGDYARYPAWSPTGDRLVYEHASTDGNLFLLESQED